MGGDGEVGGWFEEGVKVNGEEVGLSGGGFMKEYVV